MSEHTRLVEEARWLAGNFRAENKEATSSLLDALADAVEQLQRDYAEANERAHSNFDVAMEGRERGDAARARVAELEAENERLRDEAQSNVTATAPDGEHRRLTWRELVEHDKPRRDRDSRIASIVSDLDRCPHGRHEQDHCSFCQGEGHDLNQGNPFLRPGTRVGTDLSGRPIVYPGAGAGRDPDAYAEFEATWAEVVRLRAERDRLADGIRELWETWMDDDASWVEVAGTLDGLHTSLDAATDDREDG